MNPLNVLLVHRDSDVYRHLTGWWSYPVDEFQWTALKVTRNNFIVDMQTIDPSPDLVVLDDWIWGQFKNLKTPLAYVIVDSARSLAQLERNREQARFADLLLIDSDDLDKFRSWGKPARRFAYAVNEQLYMPREKTYDVAFLCWLTDERRIVQNACREICARRGWSFVTNDHGAYDWPDYARFLSSAKVVVHMPHVKAARSWRVFDVMASRGALLTLPLPDVSGDGLISGTHYRTYNNMKSLESELTYLLEDGRWQAIGLAGWNHIMANHTWRIRAKQLRETLHEALNL